MMKNRAIRFLFWLTVVTALTLILVPVIHLAPVARYYLAMPQIKSRGYTSEINPGEVVGESAHFTVLAPPGYMTQREMDQFLALAETRRAMLIQYLERPDDDTHVNIRVNPGEGVPYTGSEHINLFALKAGHTSVIHELTHFLMGYPNGLVAEGLAVITEERYGWGLSFPNMLRPVNAYLYSFFRRGAQLVPLNDLRLTTRIYQAADPERSRLRYLQSASFASYLIDQYGKSAYLKLYQSNDFPGTFGKTLEELELDWLAWARRGHILQAGVMVLAGLAVIGLFYLAFTVQWRWLFPAILAFLALTVWDYNWLYSPLLLLALLAAVLAGSLVMRFRRPWGAAILWITAAISLLGYVLLPAI